MGNFREYLNESIKVSNNNASKYFKMIQKVSKSSGWSVNNEPKNGYIVDFEDKGDTDSGFSLLVKEEGKNGYIIGYSFGDNGFREIPKIFTSIKDIYNDFKILKASKGKLSSSLKLLKMVDVNVDMEVTKVSSDEGKYMKTLKEIDKIMVVSMELERHTDRVQLANILFEWCNLKERWFLEHEVIKIGTTHQYLADSRCKIEFKLNLWGGEVLTTFDRYDHETFVNELKQYIDIIV